MLKVLVAAVLFNSLLSSSNFDVKEDVSSKKEKVKKILIIALIGNYETRKLMEQEMFYELYDLGVESATSYNTHLRSDLSKKNVIKYCEEIEADGVLFLEVVDYELPTEYVNEGGNSNVNVSVYSWGGYAYRPGPYQAGASKTARLSTKLLKVPTGEVLNTYVHSEHIGTDIEPAVGDYVKGLMRSIKRKVERQKRD